MSHDDRIDISRRRFLEAGLGVAAAAGIGGTLAAKPSEGAAEASDGIPMTVLGKTGRRLPVLGCGGAAIAPRLARFFNVPPRSFEDRVVLIRRAYDAGIRYFDTARAYQESELVYGQALEDVRSEVYLATKVHASVPDAVRPSVETSLTELRTDFIDCIQIHGQRLELAEAMAVHAELVKLKEEGLVRFIGLTGHDHFDRMYAKIDTGAFDQVLLAYGYFRKGMGNILTHEDLEWRELCLTRAHSLGMGIVSMKVMGAWVLGHAAEKVVPGYDPAALAKLPGAAIRWALRDPRVHILNIGVSELEHPPELSRRERDERQRIGNILSVALRLVLERGFSEFSMQQLAEATDYSRAALYKYFPCKEEIVIALAIESLQRRAQLYRMVPTFDGRPRERMVAMGEVSVILYPELFNTELLVFTNTFRDRTTPQRRQQVHDLEIVGYEIGAGFVRDAIDCGDLELPAGMTPEQLFFGQAMLLNGIFGVPLASGRELARTLGVGEPAGAARRFGGILMDGFNWRPLSTEWDYRATMRRIYEELFPPVVIDRIKRF